MTFLHYLVSDIFGLIFSSNGVTDDDDDGDGDIRYVVFMPLHCTLCNYWLFIVHSKGGGGLRCLCRQLEHEFFSTTSRRRTAHININVCFEYDLLE